MILAVLQLVSPENWQEDHPHLDQDSPATDIILENLAGGLSVLAIFYHFCTFSYALFQVAHYDHAEHSCFPTVLSSAFFILLLNRNLALRQFIRRAAFFIP